MDKAIHLSNSTASEKIVFFWIFSVCAPQYVMRPPLTEHVPLNSKSLCKNIARASGGANKMRPLSGGGGGGTNGKDPFFF